jgi:hypothetical protein
VELQVGPFDPELHVRSRDHYEAVRREIRLLQLQPGEPTFVARASIPDHLVTVAIQACDELAVLLEELDDWAHDKQANLLEAPEDVKRYRAAYLGQAREQFQAALG